MKIEDRVWQILSLIVVLMTAVIPGYITLYTSNHVTPKRLETGEPFATNFAVGLSPLGDRLSLVMSIDNKPVRNIVSAVMTLANTGNVPVIPSDYYEKLAVNCLKPWVILSIVANDAPVSSVWHRTDDQKFEAEPTLLNPGDAVRVSVYLTNPEVERPSQEQINDIGLRWSAHILNLSDIQTRPNILTAESSAMWGPRIELYGWGLVSTIVLSLIFMVEYVHFLNKIGLTRSQEWLLILCVVGTGFLSVAASESISTYLFPSLLVKISGVPHWMNLPWILLNFCTLMCLWWRAFRFPAYAVSQTRPDDPSQGV